jgi:hypothetical protein
MIRLAEDYHFTLDAILVAVSPRECCFSSEKKWQIKKKAKPGNSKFRSSNSK